MEHKMSNTDPIDNFENVIDSRDIRDRLDYLIDLQSVADDDESDPGERAEAEEILSEARAEYVALTDLWDEYSDSEWEHGVTLIHSAYFEDYARELAEEIGAIDRDASWPLQHIDWEAAANALSVDYSTVDFDGSEYLVR